MRNLFVELHRRNALLSTVGWAHLALGLATIAMMPFDDRLVMGVSPWLKPMKFAFSITIYVWTACWLLEYIRADQRWWKIITQGVATSMIVEIICIMLQAARGTTSHYNFSTPLDAIIFSIMGLMIMANTFLALALLYLFFKHETGLGTAYVWGIRSGLFIFLLGSGVGQHMVANLAHTVGGPDGGQGLPILNWSTLFGDLRIAHAMGLHALQILPFAGFIVEHKLAGRSSSTRRLALFAFAGVYLALLIYIYAQALAGRPVLAVEP